MLTIPSFFEAHKVSIIIFISFVFGFFQFIVSYFSLNLSDFKLYISSISFCYFFLFLELNFLNAKGFLKKNYLKSIKSIQTLIWLIFLFLFLIYFYCVGVSKYFFIMIGTLSFIIFQQSMFAVKYSNLIRKRNLYIDYYKLDLFNRFIVFVLSFLLFISLKIYLIFSGFIYIIVASFYIKKFKLYPTWYFKKELIDSNFVKMVFFKFLEQLNIAYLSIALPFLDKIFPDSKYINVIEKLKSFFYLIMLALFQEKKMPIRTKLLMLPFSLSLFISFYFSNYLLLFIHLFINQYLFAFLISSSYMQLNKIFCSLLIFMLVLPPLFFDNYFHIVQFQSSILFIIFFLIKTNNLLRH